MIISFAKSDNSVSSFLNSDSNIITLAITSRRTLNNNGDNAHLCFVPNFSEDDSNISQFSMISSIAMTWITFIMLRILFSFVTGYQKKVLKV